ncbi:MAG: FtsX-like permease family protein [Nitrospinota bacterium]|nr:MAG: FtsX-like permease family protein [Nitrospinota bacterium]
MNVLRLVRYACAEARRSLWDHARLYLLSLVVLSIALFIVEAFFLLHHNLLNLLQRWEGEMQIILYLQDEISSQQLTALTQTLQADDQISRFTYISKAEAFHQIQESLGGQRTLLAGLPPDLFPASLVIELRPEARHPHLLKEIAQRYRHLPGVDEVDYGERWVEPFAFFLRLLQKASLVIGGGLSLGVAFIIANTVRLVFYSRAQEIEILWLVGASTFCIQLPFFLEGSLQGFLGTLLSLGSLWGLYRGLMLKLQQLPFLEGGKNLFSFFPWPWIVALLLGGTLLGGVGSLLAVRRSLRL